jgi:hypothetical protein
VDQNDNHEAALKLLYLALQNITARWTMPIRDWRAADRTWRVLCIVDNQERGYTMAGETLAEAPLLGDYDGDGKIDLAI